MRRYRRLTSSERWELGLFLTMLVVGFLCLTALLNLNGVPRIFALRGEVQAASEESRPQAQEVPQSTLQLLPDRPTIQLPDPNEVSPVPSIQSMMPAAPKMKIAPKPQVEIKTFNGQKYRYVKTLKLRVTAYAPDTRCTYPYPGTTTATGLSVKTNGGKLVAADPSLIPMHALVAVPGYASGGAVPVLDKGSAIKGYRLDVLLPSFDRAKDWGSKLLEVKVYVPVN